MEKAPKSSAKPNQVQDLRQSRVGKRPIEIPKGVTLTIKDGVAEVKGPKGNLSRKLPPNVKVAIEGTQAKVVPKEKAIEQQVPATTYTELAG